MKLEKFNKSKTTYYKIGIGVAVLIGITIGLVFYHSFAYFEETKTFNIIEGKVPTIIRGDVKFAVLLDGEKSNTLPTKDSGYHLSGSECNNGASATWDETSWNVSVNNLQTAGTTCTLKFKKIDLENDLNYGDGSLNTVSRTCTLSRSQCSNDRLSSTVGGYVDKVYLYNLATGEDKKIEKVYTDYTGNFNGELTGIISTSIHNRFFDDNGYIWVVGENTFNASARGDGHSIIFIDLHCHNCGVHTYSDLKIKLGNTYYTLEQAVTEKKIKPIVLMSVLNNIGIEWLGDNPANLYNGGAHSGTYGYNYIYFMLEKNVSLTGIKVTSNKSSSSNSYFIAYKYENAILHL